jgi:hypothetical protein
VAKPDVASDHASIVADELDQDRRNSHAIYERGEKQSIRGSAAPAKSPMGDKVRQCLTNYLRLLEE